MSIQKRYVVGFLFVMNDRQRYLEASRKKSIIHDSGGCCCFSVPHFGNKLLAEFCFK